MQLKGQLSFFNFIHYGIPFLKSFCYRLIFKSFFGAFGKGTILISPRIKNPKYIFLGKNCRIEHFAWLLVIKPENEQTVIPRLVLEDEVKIGRLSEIVALSSVTLCKGVRVADNVFIADNSHKYEDIEIPYIKQGMEKLNNVEIGEYTWVGRNVCIMGCRIGKHCVIGADAVVNKDIPDYCVVVGNPARIVKRYNPSSRKWEKTDKDGNFIA